MTERKIKVFVYGSLKKGLGNHDWHLGNADYLGKAETLPQYSLFSLGAYPGVITNGKTSIQGELYAVTADELEGLDRLEGHPAYYKREVIDTSDGAAWMYLLPYQEYKDVPIIEEGIW